MSSSSSVRVEKDAFGPLDVDASRYWGAQTQRSLQNFPIGGVESRMPMEIIKAFGVLKKCAAQYNIGKGKLENSVGEAIVGAADEA
ncbi:unnamed protein product, partial [Choristocarpus tenellus]